MSTRADKGTRKKNPISPVISHSLFFWGLYQRWAFVKKKEACKMSWLKRNTAQKAKIISCQGDLHEALLEITTYFIILCNLRGNKIYQGPSEEVARRRQPRQNYTWHTTYEYYWSSIGFHAMNVDTNRKHRAPWIQHKLKQNQKMQHRLTKAGLTTCRARMSMTEIETDERAKMKKFAQAKYLQPG